LILLNGINQIKKKQQFEKIKLINYKKQLDKEKEKILMIIDELSNMNDYETTKSKPYPNYLGQDILSQYRLKANPEIGLAFFSKKFSPLLD
jgi:hypothetical protein